MRIATYNVNGIISRLPQLLAWLERESPDVVCLQELKAEDHRFPMSAIRAAGYGSVHHGQRSWNGVAILARSAVPEEIRRGLPGDPGDDQSRYLEVRIEGIHVACLYLPNGNPQPGPKFDYKLAWFSRLIRHASKLYRAKTPVVLAGDFNVVPTDFDIYDPKSWKKNALLRPESRASYARLLRQGWVDSLRTVHPDEAIFTFWDYFRNHWSRNAGLRIDHLLLNAALAPRLVDANVDRWVRGEAHASDHAPVWIELAAKASRKRPAPSRKPVSVKPAALPAGLRVSHPDRIIDPSTRATKLDLVQYYARVGKLMMAHLARRPVSLVRAPRGITGQLFFQKHLEAGAMQGVSRLDPALDHDHVALLSIASPIGLLSAAQMNTIEFHTWNAASNVIDKPDRMTFDLDPGQGVTWDAMQQAAELVRGFVARLGLNAFLKTSGGKGLHIVTPIRRQHDWDTVKNFSQAIVVHMAEVLPRQFVAKSGPGNRIGRIFIDYLRNGFGATTACAWSVRARPGLGISVPVAWRELPNLKGGDHWTLRNIDERLKTGNAPWADYARKAVGIGAAMKELRFK